MWPAPSTEERRPDAPARDGAADFRQATAASPREGMTGPSTGYRPCRHCWGRAEPRRRRVWLRSHARVEPSRSQANYRSCSLELGRRRLSSPSSPPQPVALVLAERTREKMCSGWALEAWSLGDKVHRGGVHRPFAHVFSQSAGTQVANAKAVCGATSPMQTKMRVRIRTLLETALGASCLSKTGSPILPAIWSSCIGFLVFQGPKQAARTGVFP